MIKIEIVVFNIESALLAQEGGADRIELCDNPAEGGTTPSAGVIAQICKKLTIDVYVMIRPRGGDFLYSDDEFLSMKHDINVCKQLQVDGVVFGMLTPDGKIDKVRCKELIEYAKPLDVTCHRAFDMARDPFEALNDCIEAGFDRILTSGRQFSAAAGKTLIRELVSKSAGEISIMPGAGVNESNVEAIIKETGAKEIHFSARKFVKSKSQRFNDQIQFTDSLPDDSGRWVADAEVIKRIRNLTK